MQKVVPSDLCLEEVILAAMWEGGRKVQVAQSGGYCHYFRLEVMVVCFRAMERGEQS